MSNQYKFFGSNHPNAVPADILERRVAKAEDKDEKNKVTKFILGTAAVGAAFTLLGKEAVDYNRAHPMNAPALEQPALTPDAHVPNTIVSSNGDKFTVKH